MEVPSEICDSVGGCESGNWPELLNKLANSQTVRYLKAAWKADSVMLLTKSGHRNRSSVGVAYVLSDEGDLTQADDAVSIVRFDSNEDTYIHEIFHNLGAGHSFANNKQPGAKPAAAFVGRFYHPETTGRHPIKSFMTYESVCWESFSPIPPCTELCLKIRHFSNPNVKVQYESSKIDIGTPEANNWQKVFDMMWTINNFSTYYKTSEPKISVVSSSPEPNQLQIFSAEGSTVNKGDIIEWYVILPNGEKAHRAYMADTSKLFQFVPVIAGNYSIYLKIGSKIDSHHYKVEVPEIKTPMFNLKPDQYGVAFKMTWEEISEADTYKVRIDGEVIATKESSIPFITESFWVQVPTRTGSFLTLQACDSNSGKCGNKIGRIIPDKNKCHPTGCIL